MRFVDLRSPGFCCAFPCSLAAVNIVDGRVAPQEPGQTTRVPVLYSPEAPNGYYIENLPPGVDPRPSDVVKVVTALAGSRTALGDPLGGISDIIRRGPSLGGFGQDAKNNPGRYLRASVNLRAHIPFFQTEIMAWVARNVPQLTTQQRTACKRDVGYIVEALATDLSKGGVSASLDAALKYFKGTSSVLSGGTRDLTAQSIEYLGQIAGFVAIGVAVPTELREQASAAMQTYFEFGGMETQTLFSTTVLTTGTVWNTFVPSVNSPTAAFRGGLEDRPVVRFDRSLSQHYTGPPTAFNIETNGGLTIVALVKFTDTVGVGERIIDFGSGQENNNIILSRNGTGSSMTFQIRNGSALSAATSVSGVIEQGQWTVFTARYTASGEIMQVYKNDQEVGQVTSVPVITDRTVSGHRPRNRHGRRRVPRHDVDHPNRGGGFSGCVSSGNGDVYMVPSNSTVIVTLNPRDLTVPPRETSTRVTDNSKYSAGVVSASGKLYLLPESTPSPLEYDPVADTATRLPANNETVFGPQWSAMVLLQNDTILGFAREANRVVLDITTAGQYIAVYNHIGTKWNKCSRIPYQYPLRPFELDNKTSVLFHTGGNTSYAVFDSKGITTTSPDSVPVYGPIVSDGVATYSTDSLGSDIIRIYRNSVITEIIPDKGGLAGVKSYTGNASLEVSVTNADLSIRIGNRLVEARKVFEQVYKEGKSGVFSAHLNASTKSLTLYLGESVLGGRTNVSWTGETGNTFSVGRVVGTEEASLNAPGYTGSFSGSVSEMVVFSSNQTSRATNLAENSTFFFDNDMPL